MILEGFESTGYGLADGTHKFKELAGPGSSTAMGILLIRLAESMRPDGERICYDPYAVHFVSPGILEWTARCPDEVKAMKKSWASLQPFSQTSGSCAQGRSQQ